MAMYPWPEIKAKYETGQYTIEELSKEYGFSYKYGCRKSNKEGWIKGRSREKVEQEAAKKVIDEEAEKEVELRKEYAKIIKNIRRGLANELFSKGNPNFDRLKCFKIATEALKNCRSEDWEIHEIEEMARKIKQDIVSDVITQDVSNMSKEERKNRIMELKKKLGDR